MKLSDRNILLRCIIALLIYIYYVVISTPVFHIEKGSTCEYVLNVVPWTILIVYYVADWIYEKNKPK